MSYCAIYGCKQDRVFPSAFCRAHTEYYAAVQQPTNPKREVQPLSEHEYALYGIDADKIIQPMSRLREEKNDKDL